MKKNLSKAMAAAMAIGAVAPMMGNTIVANADTVKNDLITADEAKKGAEDADATAVFEAQVRNANGYKLATRTDADQPTTDATMTTAIAGSEYLIKRNYAFDGHGTDKVSDDTLKTDKFDKDAKIIATVKGDKSDLSDHQYVIAKKLNSREQSQAKTQLDAVNNDIKALEKAGYTITTEVKTSEGLTTAKNEHGTSKIVDIYQQGLRIVTAKKGNTVYKFKFIGEENAKTDTVDSLKQEFESLKDSLKRVSTTEEVKKNTEENTTDANTVDAYTKGTELQLNVHAGKDVEKKDQKIKDRYYNLNSVIEFLETNKDKFDVEKSENPDRDVLTIKVYQKGLKMADGLVQTIKLVNYDEINTDLIVNAGGKTDFAGHWAESDIKKAMGKGYIDTTSTFRPKDSITRAEFAKIVCTVFDIDTDSDAIKNLSEPFNDVKSSNWHYKYIVALYNYQAGKNTIENVKGAVTETTDKVDKGLVINGYEDENFKPNANITRQEAAKMMAAAYELKALGTYHNLKDADKNDAARTEAMKNVLNVKFDADTTDKNTAFKVENIDKALNGVVDNALTGNGTSIQRDVKTKFTDDKEIASWADESIATLSGKAEGADVKNLSIIGGNPDGSFKPKAEINRAEALMMIMRAGDEDYK